MLKLKPTSQEKSLRPKKGSVIRTIAFRSLIFILGCLTWPTDWIERRFSRWTSRLSYSLSASIIVLPAIFVPVGMVNDFRSGYSWGQYLENIASEIVVPNDGKPISPIQADFVYWVAGASPEERHFFELVSECESGKKVGAVGINYAPAENIDGNRKIQSYDLGLLQINSKYWRKLFENRRAPQGEGLAAITNVKLALTVLRSQGSEAWVCAKRLGLDVQDIAAN